MELEYYNRYNVKYYRHTVAVIAQIRKRRIAAAVAAMCLLKKKRKKYKKKRFWVAPIFENRNEHSFFFASVPKLILEDIRFHNYFRMTATQLEELLEKIAYKLQKQDFIRESISPPERLALTLRFVWLSQIEFFNLLLVYF